MDPRRRNQCRSVGLGWTSCQPSCHPAPWQEVWRRLMKVGNTEESKCSTSGILLVLFDRIFRLSRLCRDIVWLPSFFSPNENRYTPEPTQSTDQKSTPDTLLTECTTTEPGFRSPGSDSAPGATGSVLRPVPSTVANHTGSEYRTRGTGTRTTSRILLSWHTMRSGLQDNADLSGDGTKFARPNIDIKFNSPAKARSRDS